LLDTLIRYPNTIAVLAHCDSELLGVASLGVGLLCTSQHDDIPPLVSASPGDVSKAAVPNSVYGMPVYRLKRSTDSTMDSKEIAKQLLYMLRQISVELDKSSPTSVASTGLERAITIVRTTAKTQREKTPWKSLQNMQEVTSEAINEALFKLDIVDGEEEQVYSNPTADTIDELRKAELDFDEQQPYDAFTVLIAWLVFLASAAYLLLKDSAVIMHWRRRRMNIHHRGYSISDGILSRLPDLDDAWETLWMWYREQPALIISESFSNANEGPPQAASSGFWDGNLQHQSHHHHGHHHGNVRRRRKIKTSRQ